MTDSAHIPPVGPTGKERWNQLAIAARKVRWDRAIAREQIRDEARALVRQATVDPRENMPEFYDWARDLRRGRTNILGSLFRLVDVMQRRDMGLAGRRIALELLALARSYIDLVLPDSPAPTPTAVTPEVEAVPFGPRLWKPKVAKNAVVVKRIA